MTFQSVRISPNLVIGEGKLTLLGGPCVAETPELCLEVASFLKDLCAHLDVNYIFKASFDKANRSSRGSKRGPGLMGGLRILDMVKNKLNIPIVTDVHESIQITEVAKVADVLQIPAFLCRQTDLLIAAAKSDCAINIKKGQFMAPEDMRGAVEKIYGEGNQRVLLTERGSSFGYHNLVVDMRSLSIMREIGVPVVFDATHSVQLPGGLGRSSGGQREFVRPLARAAAAIGIDALFTEVHPKPEEAYSDGPNSLDFSMIERLLTEVVAIHKLSV